ncbi:hypothetical protein E2C01_086927 [Portunus trituberculatus]|uniref:Uncharacterized protein n=1 Tax=Portunus trituberculatus TaxID=210409 RepID=A0A5B7JES0_PORTR|nr:hypothetical protein [Portunus trituberculatus]
MAETRPDQEIVAFGRTCKVTLPTSGRPAMMPGREGGGRSCRSQGQAWREEEEEEEKEKEEEDEEQEYINK